MDRRSFVTTGLAAGAAAATGAASLNSAAAADAANPPKGGQFKLKYAPHLGAFGKHVGGDPIENIKFAADQGFRALFDNGLPGRPNEQLDAIAKERERHGMTMGPFVAYADFGKETFIKRDLGQEDRDMLTGRIQRAIEVSKRANVKWALVVPGRYSDRMEWAYQTANVVENLKYFAEMCEPAGVVMVIEPLNALANHPGLFLTKIAQAYQICRAVNSPSCKIVNDIYHQQITEGNLIPNIDLAWSEIAAFHLGDTPGRNEPGTGEINYKNIFKHLANKGYDGVLCMEHSKSKGETKEGEEAVIAAYRECDGF